MIGPDIHPSTRNQNNHSVKNNHSKKMTGPEKTAVLHRSTRRQPKKAVGGEGSYVFLDDGQRFLDSTGGAAVSCVGHGNREITAAIKEQLDQLAYCHSAFFGTPVFEELAAWLVDSTGGRMSKLYAVSSGTTHPIYLSIYLSIHGFKKEDNDSINTALL